MGSLKVDLLSVADCETPEFVELLRDYRSQLGGDRSADFVRNQAQTCLVKSGELIFFGATCADELVGFICVEKQWSVLRCANVGMLEALYVRPNARGRDVADKLAETAIDWAVAEGYESVSALVNRDSPFVFSIGDRLGFERIPDTFIKKSLK